MTGQRIVYLADASSIHTRRWAAEFVRRGYEVHVLSFLPGEIPGASVETFDAGPVQEGGGNWRYLLHMPALRRRMQQLRPAILHAHYLTSYGLLAALTGVHPLVLTAWGSDVLVTPHHSRTYRVLLRFTLARADLVTSDARSMSEELRRYGLSHERLLTVPLGVDLRLFNGTARDWPAIGSNLISTRQLSPNTNLDTVLGAFELARQKIPGLRLAVVGEGPEGPCLRALAHQMGLSVCMSWLGNLGQHRLPGLLRAADLYLALTLSDSTSVSLLEAMACGALPIVSDLPANREWVQSHRNGILVSPKDRQAAATAIVEAARDVEFRRQAARRNAAMIAQRANWEQNMTHVEQAYQALMATGVKG
jgi:glycosyltransferase involved in cell wall biosynthesis